MYLSFGWYSWLDQYRGELYPYKVGNQMWGHDIQPLHKERVGNLNTLAANRVGYNHVKISNT